MTCTCDLWNVTCERNPSWSGNVSDHFGTFVISYQMSSIFVCVYKSTEFDRLKSKAASDINALLASRMLAESSMTLMNASSNRSNHNRSAKSAKPHLP